jgi:hypothetical protein
LKLLVLPDCCGQQEIGYHNRGILFLVYCHFLLLLQKKVTKEKEAGKENRFLQLSIINEQLTIGNLLDFLFRRDLLTGKPVVKHRQDNSHFHFLFHFIKNISFSMQRFQA